MKQQGTCFAIIGRHGSDKTYQTILPEIKNAIKKGESFLVTDSKYEILNYIGEESLLNGYKLCNFDLRDHKHSSTWNPFEEPYKHFRKGDFNVCVSQLFDLADEIFDTSDIKDDFWLSCAKDFFVGLSLILFEDCKDVKEINFKSLYYFAIKGEERLGANTFLKEYIKLRNKDIFDTAASCINVTLNSPSDTRGGIISTYLQNLRIFDKHHILSNKLGNSDFLLSDVHRKKVAIVLQYPDEKSSTNKILSFFIRQVFKEIISFRTLNSGSSLPFHFFFDDFLSLGKINDAEKFYTLNRDRNLNLYFSIEDISLFRKIYGKEITESFLMHCDNILCTNRKDEKYIRSINSNTTCTEYANDYTYLNHDSFFYKKPKFYYKELIKNQEANTNIPYFKFDEIILKARKEKMYEAIHESVNMHPPVDIDMLIQQIEDEETSKGALPSPEEKNPFHFFSSKKHSD